MIKVTEQNQVPTAYVISGNRSHGRPRLLAASQLLPAFTMRPTLQLLASHVHKPLIRFLGKRQPPSGA